MDTETNTETNPLRVGGESVASPSRLIRRLGADETLTVSTEQDRSGRDWSRNDRPEGDAAGADPRERDAPGADHDR